jgi:hypothetical protein
VKNHKLFLVLFILAKSLALKAVELTIDQPGVYVLGNSLTINPIAADTAIVITTSNVTLDLNTNVVSQIGAVASVNGISLSSSVSNVVIKNGILRGFTGPHIVLNGLNNAILIQDIKFESLATTAINFQSSTNCQVIDCNFYGTDTAQNNPVLLLSTCSGVMVKNALMNRLRIASAVGADNAFVTIASSNNCYFEQVAIVGNNLAPAATRTVSFYRLTSSFRNRFVGCNQIDNRFLGTGNIIRGFIIDASSQNYFNQCIFRNNSADISNLNNTVWFFYLINLAQNNLLIDCKVLNNTVFSNNAGNDGLIGFYAVTAPLNIYIGCLAIDNTCLSSVINGGSTYGFFLDGSERSTVIGFEGSRNTSLNFAVGGGVILNSSSNSTVIDCQFSRNFGNAVGVSRGFFLGALLNDLISRNIAFNNDTGPLNQFENVAGTSIGAGTTGNINAAGATPWSNLQVLP